MARLLGNDAHLVSYGAMSKAPLSLPTSLFIFKNLTAHGFMMSNWFSQHTIDDRRAVMHELVTMMEQGVLKEPVNEIITLHGSDKEMDSILRAALEKIDAGSHGRKILLQFADD